MDPAQGNTNDKQPPSPSGSSGDWRPPPPDWSQVPVSQESPHLNKVSRSTPISPSIDSPGSPQASVVSSITSPSAAIKPTPLVDTQTRGPFSTVPVIEIPANPQTSAVPSAPTQKAPPMTSVQVSGLSMEMPTVQTPNSPPTAPSMDVPTVPPAPVVSEGGALTSGGGKKGGGKLFLFILLILVIVATLGAAGFFYFYMQQPTVTIESEPSPEVVSSLKPAATIKGKLLYIKDNNVFSYDLATNKETQLTQDGSDVVTYQSPKWVSENSLSLVRCAERSTDGKSPYTCNLYTRQLTGNTPVEVASISSQPNAYGVQLGGFATYTWDSKKKQLAYLVDEFIDKNTSTKLYYKADASATAVLFKAFTMTGGRGGSLDDDVRIEFSPDGEKLLLNFTWLYPALADKDEGTLFVFDLPSKQLVWSLPQTWTSSAHFLSGHILAAKQASSGTESAQTTPQVLWIDLIKATTDAKEGITKIAEAPNWYGFLPLTKELLVFDSVATESGKGIALEELDLTAKSKKLLKEQIRPVKVLGENTVLVETMKKCPDTQESEAGCGMDIFNGYISDSIGTFDLTTKSVKNISIASVSAIIPGIDYLE